MLVIDSGLMKSSVSPSRVVVAAAPQSCHCHLASHFCVLSSPVNRQLSRTTIENEPDPIFADIDFEWDIDGRRGRFVVNDVLEASIEPIKNPVTGAPHYIAIHPHDGFEFREAEMASATFWSKGEIEQSHSKRFAAISYVSYGPYGIIAEESHPKRSV